MEQTKLKTVVCEGKAFEVEGEIEHSVYGWITFDGKERGLGADLRHYEIPSTSVLWIEHG